jgi:uncharacterized protein YqhQ
VKDQDRHPPPAAAELRLAQGVGAIGGQALVEGVMMRRTEGWGAAVRRDDGSIVTTYHTKPGPVGWRAWPLVRGVVALVDSVSLGMRALLWAANEHTTEPDEQLSGGGMTVSVLVAVVLALGLFGVLPAVLANISGVKGAIGFNALEGAVRLLLLFAYLLALSLSAEVRRTFAYHGAEHMTIHALEHGEPLTAESIRRFNRRHPRCGTSFLVLTVIVAIVVFTFLGRPGWLLLVTSRIVLLPVVAALSYEVIRFAGLHRHSWYGRVLMAPGSLVQTITTRVPDDEQIEVAVAAMHAVLAGRDHDGGKDPASAADAEDPLTAQDADAAEDPTAVEVPAP